LPDRRPGLVTLRGVLPSTLGVLPSTLGVLPPTLGGLGLLEDGWAGPCPGADAMRCCIISHWTA
jgi:hypothetical protein